MGRLDVHSQDELVDESTTDELDALEPVDETLFDGESTQGAERMASSVHPDVMKKVMRRRLEDRLDDIALKHQLDDYDYKI